MQPELPLRSQTNRTETPAWVETRQIPLLALLGTLWTLAELQIGNQLHWARLPFAGALLTAVALFVLVTVRKLVPRRGSVASVVLVVATLKVGFGGAGAPYAALGILVEGLLVELLLPVKRPGAPWAALAGLAAMSWCFVHPFLTQGILAGSGVLKVYFVLLAKAATLFGVGASWHLLIALWGLHALLGIGSGLLAWQFTSRILTVVPSHFRSIQPLGNARLP